MTLYQFNLLDETKQAETLWERGVHIGERTDEQHTVAIYQIHGFYVEVFYHRDQNEIKRFRTFSSVNQLEPYLGKIDVTYLN